MKNFGKVVILSASIIAGTSTVSMSQVGIGKAEASTTVKFSKTTYQTTANLSMRTGASTKYKSLITIPKGKVVTSTEKNGVWHKVSYTYTLKGKATTKTGWVNSSYLKEHYQYSSIAKAYYFTKKATNLYSTPDTKKKQVYTISGNNGFYSTQKVVNSLGQTWYRVFYNGKAVYVNSSDVAKNVFTSFSQTKFQASKDTYVYEFYGNAHKKLVEIPKSAVVSSKNRIGDWYSVTYSGKTGYFYIGDFSKYIDQITYKYTNTPETIYFTKQAAKLYSTADSRTKEVYTIEGNNGFASTQTAVNSLGETWYRVSYDNKVLYVNSNEVSANTFSTFPATEYKANQETTLYESFGNAHKKLAVLPKDAVVSSTNKIGDWYSVSFNGTSGYINIADFSVYLDVSEEKITDTTFVTTANVNLSKEANESSAVVAAIPDAKIVVATHKVSNGWFLVNYADKKGYVPGSLLKQVKTGDPLTGRDGYQFIDLRTQSPVTAKQINDYIAKNFKSFGTTSALSGKGQAFIDAGQKYGVNALYLAAHAIHESTFGTSAISLGKNNLFGFGSYDATAYIASYRFTSVDFNIDFIARQMKATYLSEGNWRYRGAYLGYSTKDMLNNRLDANSEGMNFYYASDPNWGKGIARHMQGILPYDKAYYRSAAVNMDVPTLPALPEGSDIFPAEIQGIAIKDLVLESSKGANDAVLTLKKGETFTLLEKTNDYWVKVLVDDNIYWTNDINFVAYANFISVKNLGRVNYEFLNVRKEPNTSATIITKLKLNDYIHLVLEKDGTPARDGSKKWHKIKLADGTIGWVSSEYVVQELK